MKKYSFIKKGSIVKFTIPVSEEVKIGTIHRIFSESVIIDDTRVQIHVIENRNTRIYNRYADELEPAYLEPRSTRS